jgi:uroporphyrinogen-III synthase
MTRPLLGKRIVITRPRAQAAGLGEKLAALGAEPIYFPTIEIARLDDYSALDRAIRALDHYHWVIFTSVNGVAAFWERLAQVGGDGQVGAHGRAPQPGTRCAAIGPATARALEARGVRPELIPDEYVAEAILEKIGDVAGQWILLPRADLAREVLADELGRRGAVVHEIAAYRTLPAAPDPQGLAELRRGVDVLTFTSSSTARNFAALAACEARRALVACIGPITAHTARELGWPVHIVARKYTTDGLVAALVEHFTRPETPLKELL